MKRTQPPVDAQMRKRYHLGEKKRQQEHANRSPADLGASHGKENFLF